ncbi:2-polyprenyl-6-methoxyphenol hydroxylase-like FAD-dependent oxidoreductase [Kineococcus xinjiangensis]|uniref:2-polyprenyl-6-methoxyphenol hydroxylase-like FAD-dependent oxidoreductase n=1 Tax=Kineococcus xinjiangensis TaxID=512762 RepID=A0A2S6IH70_9ACTN|nr:FAD-dependent monooxygenase [Kineococcus xinjiangensis]PPK93530.1 2-polyprenyl-6-methoxyphenol hydroxylase-like FAD-dependent oxidoreductase [Kineococcus xinjiangensis]
MARTAVVCGAGIGGLTAALALQREGWDVRVLERREEPLTGGTALTVSENALSVLDALGVGARARRLGAETGPFGLRRADGRWLTRPRGTTGLRCLRRDDLATLLAGALRPGTLQTAAAVTGIDPGTAGCRARVSTATTTVEADLVVGADGISSPARGLVAPGCDPRPAGYSAWRAVVTDLPEPVAAASETWGAGDRVGVVPLGHRSAYVYATAPTDPAHSPATDLAARFASWHAPVPDLLARLAGVPVHHAPVAALHRLPPRLHTGRLVLLGDAAHAMEPNLGQGACLAVEDAGVLARCTRLPAVADALAAYERARRPRTGALLALSRRLGRASLLRGRTAVAVRDRAMAAVPDALALRQVERIWAWRLPA